MLLGGDVWFKVILPLKFQKPSDNIKCAEFGLFQILNRCLLRLQSNVYLYYGLTNFYQNHRRYVKSRDDSQLLGRKGTLTTDCEPYDYVTNETSHQKIPIAPCGAIANSLFNGKQTLELLDKFAQHVSLEMLDFIDTFKLYHQESKKFVGLVPTGIAWPTDKSSKFNNPPGDVNSGEGELFRLFFFSNK